MKIKLFTAALALALAAASATSALAASHNRDTFIREQDLDKNGAVSKDEFAAGRDQEFARIDADRSGGLSQAEYVDEFKTRLPALLERDTLDRREESRVRQLRQADVRFGVLDTNKDGKISPAEFSYSGWRMFISHDTNKDGVVSAADPVKSDAD